jgi:hypothetical protein
MRNALKNLLSRLPAEGLERALAYAMLRQTFADLTRSPRFPAREALWEEAARRLGGSDTPVTVVEFGVHEGASLRWFAQRLPHPEARFIGLDTFTGLPEAWGAMPAGTFDTQGRAPVIDDARVSFLPGLFQDTAPALLEALTGTDERPLLVHYDADLYASTLFALALIDRLGRPYLAVFDEFTGHETRALRNYAQGWRAEASFLGRVMWRDRWPAQVMCRVTPGR